MKRKIEDPGNNAARILNMAVSSQLQHQQNFRLHQQRFLAPNPNRKPSEDDLFEMASMLLDPPRREQPKGNWMDRSTMINSYQSSNMSNNNNKNSGLHGHTQMTIRRNASPTNVSSGDLFDDDELDSVLGDATQTSKGKQKQQQQQQQQQQQRQYQTVTPETSERTHNEVSDIILPELTLEEMLQTCNETTMTTANGENTQDQWCLIDFGDDDNQEDDSGFSLGKTKRSSLGALDLDMDFPFKKSRQ